MRSGTEIRPEFILRLLIILGLVINVAIFFTGRNPVEEEAPLVSAATLQRQLELLRTSLEERALPTEQKAEERALGLFRLAQDEGVDLISWSSKAISEALGASGQVNMLRSNVEFRGERNKLMSTIAAFDQLFEGNVLISNIEIRGSAEIWLLRLNVTQLLSLS